LLDLTKQSGVPLSDIDNSLRLAAEAWTAMQTKFR
jgi:hypothetical protein